MSNRRCRLSPKLPAELRTCLHRVSRVHAHLLATVRLYGSPGAAGGVSDGKFRNEYVLRVRRGDRTILYDALTLARDELDAIREEVQQAIDAASPTVAPPGSREKIAELVRRAKAGQTLFSERDKQ